MQHVSILKVIYFRILIVPTFVRDFLLRNATDDVLNLAVLQERLFRWIYPNPLASADLPKRLTRRVSMIKYLSIRRRNQHADGMLERPKVRHVVPELC